MNSNLIRIATSINDLIGDGEEWLLTQDNEIIAVFIDGNLKNRLPASNHNSDVTDKGTEV